MCPREPFKLNFVAALALSYFWLQLANQVLCYWKELCFYLLSNYSNVQLI